MKRKILNILVVVLTVSIIFESYMCFKNIKNNKILEDIKTVDIFDNKDNALSIMIQQPDYTYKEDTSRTAWPSTSEYLYSGAKCTDKDGKDIGDTSSYISFEETSHTATITTKKTIYCTLYFANGRPALEVLDKQGGQYYAGGKTGDSKVAVSGLYRFKGIYSQVTNNYICLGADENPDKCKTNANNMYRIIGVTDGSEASTLGLEKGMLKVIKATPSKDTIKWAESSYFVAWDSSACTTREYLNDTFYNGSTINARIKPYIAEVHWWIGDNMYDYSLSEVKEKTRNQYRIGLMYASDYYNSWSYAGDGYNPNTNSWLNICHGLSSGAPSCGAWLNDEWTMTRKGWIEDLEMHEAWVVSQEGYLAGNLLDWDSPNVRPVFYLASNVGLVGLGTESSPYTITTIK